MEKINLLLFCIYNNTDTNWLDDVFDVEKVVLSEIVDIDGSNGIAIQNITDYVGWDYIVIPINQDDRDDVVELFEELNIPFSKCMYIINGDLVINDFQLIKEYLNPVYRMQQEYKSGVRKIINEARSKQEYCWIFVGTDYKSIRRIFRDFGIVDNTCSFFIDPLSSNPVKSLKDMLEKMHDKLTNVYTIPCFIIYARVLDAYPYLDKVLKAFFPMARLFLYYGDLVTKHGNTPDLVKKKEFEDVFTFDKFQAQKYGIKYLRMPYCMHPDVKKNHSDIRYDCVYVGEGKGRLATIIKVYEKLTSMGMLCGFYVYGVDEFDKKYDGEIIYNKWLEYDELLEIEDSANIILEVMQDIDNTYSPTIRYAESKFLHKKLLTNCNEFKNCIDNNVIYYDNPDEIKAYKLMEPYEDHECDYSKMFSVETMIKNIKKQIEF